MDKENFKEAKMKADTNSNWIIRGSTQASPSKPRKWTKKELLMWMMGTRLALIRTGDWFKTDWEASGQIEELVEKFSIA